jgi:23S rRNA pseudouridine1911/1915/1917 synthase
LRELFQIIHEDGELLAINKPAGLVCHPTKTDEYSSLISRVRLYLGEGSHPQLVNRLDRETSGVTLVAKTAEAARELRRLWENRQVRKEYAAIVHGHPAEPHGTIESPLGKDLQSAVAIKACVRADGAPARTEFWVERNFLRTVEAAGSPGSQAAGLDPRPFSLLRVVPQTGRKHQIRIHLAHLGHPIVGEKLYGGDEDLYLSLVEDRLTPEQRRRLILPHHALHAASVQFSWRGEDLRFTAPAEDWFAAFARGQD